MSGAKAMIAQGHFVGSASAVTINLPWVPVFMMFINDTGEVGLWTAGMPDGMLQYSGTAEETSNGITLSGTTVTLGASEGVVNAATEDVRWVAFGK